MLANVFYQELHPVLHVRKFFDQHELSQPFIMGKASVVAYGATRSEQQ